MLEKKVYVLRKAVLAFLLSAITVVGWAQGEPVKFSVSYKQVSAKEVDVVFSGSIDNGWHVYSSNLPGGGPTAATVNVEAITGAKPVGRLRAVGKEVSVDDPVFGMRVNYFEHHVQFVQRFAITSAQYHIRGYLEYGACNDHMCMPPQSVDFETKHGNSAAATAPAQAAQTEDADKAAGAADDASAVSAEGVLGGDSLGNAAEAVPDSVAASTAPVDSSTAASLFAYTPPLNGNGEGTGAESASHSSLWYIFLMGLLGGLVALFTPCVWPIIPMTVSFFLHRSDNRRRGIRDAITYGVSIIVIYMLLAFLVTALFGPQRLNDMATNAPFNIFFFLLLVVFALSFFGMFELRLPSKWGNNIDTKASKTTGLLSIFLMAFTLSLVSFSCTAPVVGLLLVEAATSNNWVAPTVGMFGFALALALPFTLFAMFPSWMKKAPKSGQWMNTVKVVLGFIELAFSLKFLSVADLAYGWGILDRETFLSLWIAIFLLLGLYLLGIYHFRSDGPSPKAQPVACMMLGLVSIAFAIYMVPGLWGAPCKAVSAFAPPMYTQDFNLNKQQDVRAKFNDYEKGMAYAKAVHKPVLLDFTGFGCVNCRKMEASVWTDPEVQKRLTDDYVLISLYVDDKTPLDKTVEITDSIGKKHKLRTVGDKWSYLEQAKFGYLAQPFYVAIDNDGRPLGGSFTYKEDVKAYLDFLDHGIKAYQSK